MKKGAIIFSVLLFLAGAGLLLVIQNHRTDKSAVYVETGSGTDYDCQAVNIKEEAYLFLKTLTKVLKKHFKSKVKLKLS